MGLLLGNAPGVEGLLSAAAEARAAASEGCAEKPLAEGLPDPGAEIDASGVKVRRLDLPEKLGAKGVARGCSGDPDAMPPML